MPDGAVTRSKTATPGKVKTSSKAPATEVIPGLRVEVEKEAREVFKKMDTSKDQKLDRKEITSMGKELKQNWTASEVDGIFQRVDKDKSNMIDIDEFLAWWVPHKEEEAIIKELRKSFPASPKGKASGTPISPKKKGAKGKDVAEVKVEGTIAEGRMYGEADEPAAPAGPGILAKITPGPVLLKVVGQALGATLVTAGAIAAYGVATEDEAVTGLKEDTDKLLTYTATMFVGYATLLAGLTCESACTPKKNHPQSLLLWLQECASEPGHVCLQTAVSSEALRRKRRCGSTSPNTRLRSSGSAAKSRRLASLST